jgi:hypothetical protein
MNMLVERGRVPFMPANDEMLESIDSMPDVVSEFADFEEYEALRKEVFAFHVVEWQKTQLEVASKIGMGPPRSL